MLGWWLRRKNACLKVVVPEFRGQLTWHTESNNKKIPLLKKVEGKNWHLSLSLWLLYMCCGSRTPVYLHVHAYTHTYILSMYIHKGWLVCVHTQRQSDGGPCTHGVYNDTLLPLLGPPILVKDQAMAGLEATTIRASPLFPFTIVYLFQVFDSVLIVGI